MLRVQANGTNGNPITIKFESGALLTAPYWAGGGGGAINVSNQSYIVIDGGTPCGTSGTCNGVIQNTANGTGLTYQSASYGIEGSGCNNCEYKNLGIYNIYVHAGLGNEIDQTAMQAIHVANSTAGNPRMTESEMVRPPPTTWIASATSNDPPFRNTK